MVVTNNGVDPAVGPFTVVDTLPTLSPEPLVYVSATGTGWSCTQAAGVVRCTRTDTLAGCFVPPISLTVRPPADFLGDDDQHGHGDARTYDPNLTNNSSTVIGRPSTTRPTCGSRSRGPSRRSSPVDGDLPAGRHEPRSVDVAGDDHRDRHAAGEHDVRRCAPTTAAAILGLCAPRGRRDVLARQRTTRPPVGDLLAGTAAPQIPITVLVAPRSTPGRGPANSATVTAGATIDPVSGNNTDTDVGAPAASADLSINKQATGALVAGRPATYRLRVDNFGPSNAAAP